MLNLHSQLYLGNLGNRAGHIFGSIVLFGSIPLFIWLVVSLIRWLVFKSPKLLKWWAILSGSICLLGLIIIGYEKSFSGAPFSIAQRINIYIPMSVHVLENDAQISIDEVQEYDVVRFNQTQLDSFVKSAKEKGWKFGTVVPYSLTHPSSGHPGPMSGRKYPLPKVKRDGYYYSSIKKRYGYRDWYTTRMAYFLDVKSRTLYIYYDDAQWG